MALNEFKRVVPQGTVVKPTDFAEAQLRLEEVVRQHRQAITNKGIADSASTVTNGPVVFSNSNGVIFGLSGSTMTASAAGGGLAIGASNGTVTNGTALLFAGTNITIGTETGSKITFSCAAPGTAAGPAVSAGSQSVASGTVVFSNSNNVSFGMSGNSRITASIPAVSAVSGIAGSGASTLTNGTIQFGNLNGMSFGLNGSTMTASYSQSTHSHITYLGGIAGSNASTVTDGSVQFANSNGLTFGLNGSTITGSHNGLTYIAGANTNTSGKVQFIGSNGISFSLTGIGAISSWMFAEYAAPRGIAGSGASTLTKGTLQFANSNGVSFGLNGSTMTASVVAAPAPATVTMLANAPAVFVSNLTVNKSLLIGPLLSPNFAAFPGVMTVDSLYVAGSFNSNANMSAARSYSLSMGLYSISNSHTLALVNSWSTALTNNADANASKSWHGFRWITFGSNDFSNSSLELTNQPYFLAHLLSTSGTTMNMSFLGAFNQGQQTNNFGTAGVDATAAINQPYSPFWGDYSATTGALPASIHRTDIIARTASAYSPAVILRASDGISGTF